MKESLLNKFKSMAILSLHIMYLFEKTYIEERNFIKTCF